MDGVGGLPKLVLATLSDRCDVAKAGCNPTCYPSQSTLMESTGISKTALNNALNKLEHKGFIHRFKPNKGGNTHYALAIMPIEAATTPLPNAYKWVDLPSSSGEPPPVFIENLPSSLGEPELVPDEDTKITSENNKKKTGKKLAGPAASQTPTLETKTNPNDFQGEFKGEFKGYPIVDLGGKEGTIPDSAVCLTQPILPEIPPILLTPADFNPIDWGADKKHAMYHAMYTVTKQLEESMNVQDTITNGPNLKPTKPTPFGIWRTAVVEWREENEVSGDLIEQNKKNSGMLNVAEKKLGTDYAALLQKCVSKWASFVVYANMQTGDKKWSPAMPDILYFTGHLNEAITFIPKSDINIKSKPKVKFNKIKPTGLTAKLLAAAKEKNDGT